MVVAVGASSFAENNYEIEELFKKKGLVLKKNPFGRKMTEAEIIDHLRCVDGLLAGLEPLNRNVLSQCTSLKAIARIGIGVDNVDFDAAKEFGIKVSNTPEGPTDAVAEMTLTALLMLCHNVTLCNRDIHNGIWRKRLGKSISEMNILLIGYGRIGKKVEEMLSSIGASIDIFDKYNPEVSTLSLEEGIEQADVISIHASGTEEILSKEMFRKLKKGVFILNSARGSMVNEDALYESLMKGDVAGFWGDALWQEPYTGKVTECDNAILTPHVSTYTSKCRRIMEKQAVENLFRDMGV